MTKQQIEQQVIQTIQQSSGAIEPIMADTNFVSSGILDSFAILSMIMHLEQEFEIKFAMDELADVALQTPAGLAALIDQKVV